MDHACTRLQVTPERVCGGLTAFLDAAITIKVTTVVNTSWWTTADMLIRKVQAQLGIFLQGGIHWHSPTSM